MTDGTKKPDEIDPALRAAETKAAFKRNFLALLWTHPTLQSQIVFKGELRIPEVYRRPHLMFNHRALPFYPPKDLEAPSPRDTQVRGVLAKLLVHLFDEDPEIRNLIVLRAEIKPAICYFRQESIVLHRHEPEISPLSARDQGLLDDVRGQVKDLLLTDPDVRNLIVIEGDLRPEAYRLPRWPIVDGGKTKR